MITAKQDKAAEVSNIFTNIERNSKSFLANYRDQEELFDDKTGSENS
jgi:hypothetical protein